MNNYYQRQLDSLKLRSDTPTIKISVADLTTHHLTINVESLPYIRDYLNYIELKLTRGTNMKLEQFTTKIMKKYPCAKQLEQIDQKELFIVLTDNDGMFILSYETPIAIYNGNWKITEESFSRTTNNHKRFLAKTRLHKYIQPDEFQKLFDLLIKSQLPQPFGESHEGQ